MGACEGRPYGIQPEDEVDVIGHDTEAIQCHTQKPFLLAVPRSLYDSLQHWIFEERKPGVRAHGDEVGAG